MKPLVRWTIGNVHPNGFISLKISIKKFLQIYGNRFDYLICHNSLTPEQINEISQLNIPLYSQQKSDLIIQNPTTAWKLYPPRLRIQTHEILLDNDLIITKALPAIDRFLNDEIFLITEAYSRNFGNFDSYVPKNLKLNTGLIGIPPCFNLTQNILKKLSSINYHTWKHYFDEQGLLASIVIQNKYEMIPLDDISVIKKEFRQANYGYHFVGLNQGNNFGWNEWKQNCLML